MSPEQIIVCRLQVCQKSSGRDTKVLTQTASGMKVGQKIRSQGKRLQLLTAGIREKFLDTQAMFDFFTRIYELLCSNGTNKLNVVMKSRPRCEPRTTSLTGWQTDFLISGVNGTEGSWSDVMFQRLMPTQR
jgi:hypothetical protein